MLKNIVKEYRQIQFHEFTEIYRRLTEEQKDRYFEKRRENPEEPVLKTLEEIKT